MVSSRLLCLVVHLLVEVFHMDPIIVADATDIEAKVDVLKTAQANVAPLQATADAANSALAAGQQAVTTATNDVDAAVAKLVADIKTIEGGGTPPPPPPPPSPTETARRLGQGQVARR
jgi:hypothetical protein